MSLDLNQLPQRNLRAARNEGVISHGTIIDHCGSFHCRFPHRTANRQNSGKEEHSAESRFSGAPRLIFLRRGYAESLRNLRHLAEHI